MLSTLYTFGNFLDRQVDNTLALPWTAAEVLASLYKATENFRDDTFSAIVPIPVLKLLAKCQKIEGVQHTPKQQRIAAEIAKNAYARSVGAIFTPKKPRPTHSVAEVLKKAEKWRSVQREDFTPQRIAEIHCRNPKDQVWIDYAKHFGCTLPDNKFLEKEKELEQTTPKTVQPLSGYNRPFRPRFTYSRMTDFGILRQPRAPPVHDTEVAFDPPSETALFDDPNYNDLFKVARPTSKGFARTKNGHYINSTYITHGFEEPEHEKPFEDQLHHADQDVSEAHHPEYYPDTFTGGHKLCRHCMTYDHDCHCTNAPHIYVCDKVKDATTGGKQGMLFASNLHLQKNHQIAANLCSSSSGDYRMRYLATIKWYVLIQSHRDGKTCEICSHFDDNAEYVNHGYWAPS